MRHLISTLAIVFASIGCTAETPERPIAEGLTVLESGEGALHLAFRSGETVIFMEALRGGPGAYDSPDMPRFEVDARFVAENGVAFYVVQGGDDMVDPSWNDDRQRQTDRGITREANEELFEIGDEILAVLRPSIVEQIGEDAAADLEPEIHQLEAIARDLAPAARTSLATHREYLEGFWGVPQVEGEGGEVVYGTNGPEDAERALAANYYYVAVHGACIASTLCAGRHSATRIYEWIGAWNTIHNFSNHGRSAAEMDQQGLLQYYEALSDYHPAWTAQTCSTPYHWDSPSGNHNCHDDSRRQMMNFVYNVFPARNVYHCSDSSTNKWHEPSTNGDDDEGYNHPNLGHPGRGVYDNGSASSCPDSYRSDGWCDVGCRFGDGTHVDPECRP